MDRAKIFELYGLGIYHSSTRLYSFFNNSPRKHWAMCACRENTKRQLAALTQEKKSERK